MKLPFKMLKKRPKIIIFCKCPDQTMDLINMLLPVTDRRSTMCRFYILNTNTSLSLCLLLWHQCWSEDLTVNNYLIEGKQHKRRIWDKSRYFFACVWWLVIVPFDSAFFFFFACMVTILYDFCYLLCSHYAVVSFSMPIVACVYVKRVSMLSSD